MEEDMISQLPDDILSSIITHSLTNEAVRTSILSKSWRNIYKFVPSINIACRCTLPRQVDCNFEVIMNGLRGLSQLHCGFIRSFKFRCCLSQAYSRAFEEIMYSLGKHIEKLDVQFTLSMTRPEFIFPCDFLSHMPSLRYLRLRYCVLQPNFSSHCHSLKTLRLSGVVVAPGSLECVLSSCLSLTTLLVRHCDLPKKLGLRGPQVRCIMIYDEYNVDVIELYAGNLISLEFYSLKSSVDISFDYVPQLQHIYLQSFKYFHTLAKDMPHLKSIHINFDYHIRLDGFIQRDILFKGDFLFNNLKRLQLSDHYNEDVLSLIPFLHSCPNLQEFNLALLAYRRCRRWEKSVVVHRELKKVEISGYRDELELVSYILRSAVSLQQLYVSWFGNRYDGFGQWHERRSYEGEYTEDDIEIALGRIRALEPLATSKTVQVMAERSPRRRSKLQDEIWAEEPCLGL